MKYLLILMIMLLSVSSFAQVKDTTYTGIKLEDEVFLKILKEFTDETRRRGIYIDHFISSDLGSINVLTLEEISSIDQRVKPKFSAAGITYRIETKDVMGFWHSTPAIGISEDVMGYGYDLIKVIIFHELGHFFGLDHVGDKKMGKYGMHIMCPLLTDDYINKEITPEAMEDYYTMLKEIKRYKRMRRNSNNK